MARPTILLSAANGPVIGADDTGVVLHLSDRVIRDIARRMGVQGGPPVAPEVAPQAPPAWLPDDIDWWNAQAEGSWIRFDARLAGTGDSRRYARHAAGPGIVADAPGVLRAVISVAGPRRHTQRSQPPDYPFHVIACPPPEPGEAPLFANCAHSGIDSGICDALLARRQAGFRRLPVHVAQSCLLPGNGPLDDADLSDLSQFLDRLGALAAGMGKTARLTALAFEIGAGHLAPGSDAETLHRDALRLLDRIAGLIRAADMGDAPVLLTVDAGAWWGADRDASLHLAEAVQRLILCPGPHRIIPVGSTAGMAQDAFAMPGPGIATAQAAREAWFIEAAADRRFAGAPVLYLAERVDARCIRATFKTPSPLAIDPDRQDRIGPGAGFVLDAAGRDLPIAQVEPDPADSGALLITVAEDLPGQGILRLGHALPRPCEDGAGYDATAILAPTDAGAPTLWAMPARMVVR